MAETSNSAKRVLPPEVFDALELSALAFGGIGSRKMFERDPVRREPILDAPYCAIGLAWWSGIIPDEALRVNSEYEGTHRISEGLFSGAVYAAVGFSWEDNDRAVHGSESRITFREWCRRLNVVRGDTPTYDPANFPPARSAKRSSKAASRRPVQGAAND